MNSATQDGHRDVEHLRPPVARGQRPRPPSGRRRAESHRRPRHDGSRRGHFADIWLWRRLTADYLCWSEAINGGESACTPDSVTQVPCGAGVGGHPSRPAVARRLQRPTRGSLSDGPPSPCLALLRVGFTEPPGSPRALVRSCRTVAPLPVRRPRGCVAIGGFLSVALSCGSPRLGVTQHPALWSPDVPRAGQAGTRPPGRLTTVPHGTGPGPASRLCRLWPFGPGQLVRATVQPAAGRPEKDTVTAAVAP